MTSLVRYRGDTIPDQVTVKDSAGVVVNITGYTFKLTVNSSKAPSGTEGQAMQVDGVIINAAGGVVEFRPSAVQADVEPGRYYYDVQMIDASGYIQTIVFGTYTFKQDITK